ncbi:MAG TPA: adenylate/guanylate cyclase domain-containing protein [Stellaceae bacterium]
MSDLSRLLAELGLSQYENVFVDNDVDADVLPHLTDADLKELGLSLGHRRKLLAALGGAGSPGAASAATPSAAADPSAAPPPAGAAAAGAPQVPVPAPPSPSPAPPEAERRQLTVMFCDMVGSTELTARLGPEEMGTLLRQYQDMTAGAIARFDGFVGRFVGDGVLAYFGYPHAHEDAAERAVRAALDIVETVAQIRTPDGAAVRVRIGIASGIVVIGELLSAGAAKEQAVIGDPVNLAARLQQIAPQNGVVTSTSTRALLRGRFDVESIGQVNLHGIGEPVTAWRVLAARAAASRFDAEHLTELTAVVGRDQEASLLLDRWDIAKSGEGQVVLLCGEAGVGKSRIAEMLRQRIAEEPHSLLLYQCSPFYANSALQPAIGQTEYAAGIAAGDPPDSKLAKLESLLAKSGADLGTAVPLLASLLSIPADGRYTLPATSPEQQKQRTLQVLTDHLIGTSRRRPVLLIVEDAHWIDPTTLELLSTYIDRIQHARVLIVITYRPDFQHHWGVHAHVTALSLNRLGRRHSTAMIEHLTGGKTLPPEVQEQIVTKTDGVPLFIEELTKTILESGLLKEESDRYVLIGPLPPFAIPATLQDSLLARLDRLAPIKEVAQIGATIGREFSYELLAALAPVRDNALNEALAQLVEAELVLQRGTPPHSTYLFKHALVQEAAYSTMLRSKRQQLHLRCARTLAERFAGLAETQPELFAHHYTEAALPEPAAEHWLKAGQRAAERSANLEAIGHLNKGLAVAGSIVDPVRRQFWEMRLQVAVGMPLIATRGYAAPETRTAWTRARELAMEVGDESYLSRALYGLWACHTVGGAHRTALATAEQLMETAAASGNTGHMMVAHRLIGVCRHNLGDHESGRAELETVLRQYEPGLHRPLAFHFGQDQHVAALAFLSLVLWLQGYPDQALKMSRSAVAEARSFGHANSIGYSLAYGACAIAQLCGEHQVEEELAGMLLRFAEDHALDLWHAFGLAHQGSVLISRGAYADGVARLRAGVAGFEETRSGLRRPVHLAMLAYGLGKVGQPGEGLAVIDAALAECEQNEERWCLPELLRMKGVLLLTADRTGQAGAAADLFRQSLDRSRSQRTPAWTLRAAYSLARLVPNDENYRILEAAYGCFSEGFGTADLRRARMLLDEQNPAAQSA